jgi:ribosomal protein S18 acetylase RimI-like enzyme
MWTVRGGYAIRPVRDDELEAMVEVYRQCEDFLALTPQPNASPEMVRSDLNISKANGGLFCGIYAPDGKMVGVLDVILKGFEGNPHHAFIELLMIARAHRSGGLGSAVVDVIERQIMADADVTAILSGVMVNNPAALRFWQRHGYAVSGGPVNQTDGTTTWDLHKKVPR